MIYLDEQGFPVNNTLDGYDSALRAGILLMTKDYHNEIRFSPDKYAIGTDTFVRHPNKFSANNPKNFTNDQMSPLIAGLSSCDPMYRTLIRDYFWARAKCFFFQQNTERDKPGSKKYLRTHYFYKDSEPNTDTWFDSSHKIIEGHEIECKIFDGPDPMLPNKLGQLILAGRIYSMYWFLLIAWPLHLLSLVLNFNSMKEQNQLIADSFVYGTLKLYRMLNPKWHDAVVHYWDIRGEIEYAAMLEKIVMGEK